MLQNRDLLMFQPYLFVDDTIRRLKDIQRNMEAEFADWFREARELTAPIDVDIKMTPLTGRQIYRPNPVPDQKTFRNTITDHLKKQMTSRLDDRVGFALFGLIPSNVFSERDLH